MSGLGSDYTRTPSLGLYKPIANMAVGLWGDLWNANADAIDSAIHFASGGGPFLPLAGNATIVGPFDGSVIATGGMPARMLSNRFADVVNVKDFGAVFDGNSHPLSATFTTLAAAQEVYPHAVALTDEIDGVAIRPRSTSARPVS